MLDHLQLFILPTVITVIGFSPFKIKWLGQYSYLLEGEKIEPSKEGHREERAMKKEWIDGGDILDGPARFGLVKGLEHAGLRAVVFMTAAAPAKVADPAKWPYGPLYWTGDNTVTPLADAIAAKTSKDA
jgi:hypothetical protein